MQLRPDFWTLVLGSPDVEAFDRLFRIQILPGPPKDPSCCDKLEYTVVDFVNKH